jgi:hypothetical protein
MRETNSSMVRQFLWGLVCGVTIGLSFRNRNVRHRANKMTESQLDEMIQETFPASDAPSY